MVEEEYLQLFNDKFPSLTMNKHCKETEFLEQMCLIAVSKTEHLFKDTNAHSIKYESKIQKEDGKKYKVKIEISLDKDEL